MKFLCGILFLISAAAEFGDYVDYSFQCPIQPDPSEVAGSCDQVCVETAGDCPALLQCTDTLCADGSCQVTCPGGLTNPCSDYGIYSTACYMDGYSATPTQCSKDFSSEYSNMDNCCADDDAYNYAEVPRDYAGFVFFFCWICGVTAMAFLYFAYNNKIAPVGESVPLVLECKLFTSH